MDSVVPRISTYSFKQKQKKIELVWNENSSPPWSEKNWKTFLNVRVKIRSQPKKNFKRTEIQRWYWDWNGKNYDTIFKSKYHYV